MQQVTVKISSDIINDAYLPYMFDDTAMQIFFGGSSAGKTVAMCDRATIDVCNGSRNYLIAKKFANSIRGSIFNDICQSIEKLKVSSYFKINKSPAEITCKMNGYQMLFAGLDDVERVHGIRPQRGVITDILCDEATQCDVDDIKLLKKRLRGISKVKKRTTLLFNPILRSHSIYKEYFEGKFNDGDTLYRDRDLLILKTTYKDNKYLELDDIYNLENETDEYLYNVYTLGNWGTLGRLIYKNWEIQDLTSKMKSFDNYYNGLDFGFANDPTAYVRSHYDRMRKIIYITRDNPYGIEMTNQMIAKELSPIISAETIYCDSAEPKSIVELINCGINALPCVKGKDSVVFGIQWLQGHTIIIHHECKNVICEIQQYQWKKNRLTGLYENKPVDERDHTMDAIRYEYSHEMFETKHRIKIPNQQKRIIKRTGRKNPFAAKKTAGIPVYW